MNKLTSRIRNHQLVSFYLITFAITWGLSFSFSAVLQREQWLLAPIAFLSVCGPALAGIIVSAVTNTRPMKGSRKSYWTAFFIAWAVSALVAISHNTLIEQVPLSPVIIGLFIISVVPVAYVISTAYSRNPTVSNYVSSLVRPQGVWGWSLLALFLLPALILISIPVSNFLGGRPGATHSLPDLRPSLFGLIAVKFLYQLLFFNATGEETGWRGFALPRLQARTSPLIAALIIALFWAPWHFFVWQAEGRPVLTLEFWVTMYTGHILFSVILVWICNRAGGSILVAGIAHASANTAFAFANLMDLQGVNLIWLVAVIIMILADRMWERLPTEHTVQSETTLLAT